MSFLLAGSSSRSLARCEAKGPSQGGTFPNLGSLLWVCIVLYPPHHVPLSISKVRRDLRAEADKLGAKARLSADSSSLRAPRGGGGGKRRGGGGGAAAVTVDSLIGRIMEQCIDWVRTTHAIYAHSAKLPLFTK